MPPHSYGYNPDSRDQNDHLYAADPRIARNLPAIVDLRSGCPPVYDQGNLGSCTANAIAAAIEYNQIKQGLPEATPSRLFVYFDILPTAQAVGFPLSRVSFPASTRLARFGFHRTGSDSLSTGEDGLSSRHNVLCCIDISVMLDAAFWTRPMPDI
jgi:hypothetical protein